MCRDGEEKVLEDSGGLSEQIHRGSLEASSDVHTAGRWAARRSSVGRDQVWSWGMVVAGI